MHVKQDFTCIFEWNLGKVEAYHYCLDRMYTRSSEKKHWFRHAKRALPLDTYDTCVKDLLIEPLSTDMSFFNKPRNKVIEQAKDNCKN